jgi:hypothetical protein
MHDPEQGAGFAAATEAAQWHAGLEGLTVTFERIVVPGDVAVASFVVDAHAAGAVFPADLRPERSSSKSVGLQPLRERQ